MKQQCFNFVQCTWNLIGFKIKNKKCSVESSQTRWTNHTYTDTHTYTRAKVAMTEDWTIWNLFDLTKYVLNLNNSI